MIASHSLAATPLNFVSLQVHDLQVAHRFYCSAPVDCMFTGVDPDGYALTFRQHR
jgi:hypothetical protein